MSSSPLLVASCVAALVGAGAAWLTVTLSVDDRGAGREASAASRSAADVRSSGTDAARRATSGSVHASTPEGAALQAELETLRTENRELTARVKRLESQVNRTPQMVETKVPTKSSLAAADLVDDPDFQEGVTEALSAIREAEAADEKERWVELQSEKVGERISKLTDKLGLYPNQVTELHALLLDRELKRNEISELGKEHSDKDATRAALRTLRDETNDQLALILTPEQLRQYRKTEGERDDKRFGGGAERANDRKKTDRGKGNERRRGG